MTFEQNEYSKEQVGHLTGIYSNEGAVKETMKRSSNGVGDQIDGLDKHLDLLSDQIRLIYNKLNPILSGEEPSDVNPNEPRPGGLSEVAERLQNFNDRLNISIRSLTILHDRVNL